MTTEPQIRHGGLMRCCLTTWHDYMTRGDLASFEPGDFFACNYCREHMILADDGVWEWRKQ